MLDFGEGLNIETLSVPWLIWIQLLVLLLLLALLFGFSIIALDPSHPSIAPTASTTQQHQQQPSNYHSTAVTNRLQTTPENASIKSEIVSNGSREIVREEIAEGEASTSSLYFLHPCYYFNLAKKAFLKCLGQDSTSDDPSTQKHNKTKES
ncbi:uncharacterized protein HKW66_Vig0012160 [Vigna angularis]|uniref:Uncharacterized protein n=2 Tax=Phaseolus angularis TaxID=3914 RepID=A0A8T0LGH7_PHAAN|nr:uncharacterized protein LOC108340064 [Vigna angularis]KAG2410551.1 uncharacterized protein HKW66_Vig0012160 [Vigna angularis]BAT73336.1 hypothetical protein VIGAN_01081000 [Vigna angularis var. angularis]